MSQKWLAQLSGSLLVLNLGFGGFLTGSGAYPLTAALGRLTSLTGIWLGPLAWKKGAQCQADGHCCLALRHGCSALNHCGTV